MNKKVKKQNVISALAVSQKYDYFQEKNRQFSSQNSGIRDILYKISDFN